MKNFKECSDEDYETAISMKDCEIEDIPDDYLYILYTKFVSDINTIRVCSGGFSRHQFSSYQYGIMKSTEHYRDLYKEELVKRGLI